MDEIAFKKFLKKGGRSDSAVKRCMNYSNKLLKYIADNSLGSIHNFDEMLLNHYVEELELQPKYNAKTDLWSLIYLFEFLKMDQLEYAAKQLRQDRIHRTSFKLRDFRGVNNKDIEKLERIGIGTVTELLARSRTSIDRRKLASESGVDLASLLELVKLSDISRIGAIKSIRARLYYDAGLQTPDDFVKWNPNELREMLVKWVVDSNFDGIPPLPKEIESAIDTAKNLSKIIDY